MNRSKPFFPPKLLCRMWIDGPIAIGPFARGLLILRPKPDLRWDAWAEDVIDHETHEVCVADIPARREIKVAHGIRSRDLKGKPFVRAHLGPVPLVFEDSGAGKVTCSIGHKKVKKQP